MCIRDSRRITLRMEIDESLKDVMLDAALFEQVLVNIIKNAAESIEADGEIIVRTLAPAGKCDQQKPDAFFTPVLEIF